MPRLARFQQAGAWHHVHAKVAGKVGEYILGNATCQREMIRILKHYSRVYCCELGAFCVMGNHWHGVLCFEMPRKLAEDALFNRAKMMYPNSQKELKKWTPLQWDRFNRRIFELSEFMRNVQAAFARWYNKTHERQGRFWSDRFKSTVLSDEKALLNCMLYVDLNPIRAGIAERPEDYEGGSAWFREICKDDWLTGMHKLLGRKSRKEAWKDYKELLYYRGSVPTKVGQCAISKNILENEIARGFKTSGVFLKRMRYFTDGIMIGTEVTVRQQLASFRKNGRYLRRKHPIPQNEGCQFSLREQRCHALHMR